jgi:hypothetical protein
VAEAVEAMTTTTQTLADWLLGCIAEDEAVARTASPGPWHTDGEEVRAVDDITVCDAFALSGPQTRATADHIARQDPAHVLAVCAAHRAIVELHESWPVLVEGPPQLESLGSDMTAMTMRMARQIAWLTTAEYRARFGDEPPAAPMLRALALAYADRPGFQESWRP